MILCRFCHAWNPLIPFWEKGIGGAPAFLKEYRIMSVICVPDQKRFSAEKFQKVNLFDTERMFCDIYCFEPGQVQKPHAHAENDKIYYVLEGKGTFLVGDEQTECGPGIAVLCPPGVDHGVINTGTERLVVLVYMAPHP